MPGVSTNKPPATEAQKEKKPAKDITTKPLYAMDKEEAIEFSNSNYKIAWEDKQEALIRAVRYDNIYRALDPPDTRINEGTKKLEEDQRLYANTYLPVAASRVDTAVSNEWSAMFAGPEYLQGESADEMDDLVISSKIVPHMINTYRQTKFKYTVFKALLGAACFEYGVTLGYWQLEPGFIPQRKVFNEIISLGKVKMPHRRVEIEMDWVPDKIDRFNVAYLPYRNCFHDPNSKNSLEDSEYFFDYRRVPLGKLMGQEKTEDNPGGRYFNLDKVEALVKEQKGTNIGNITTDDGSITNLVWRERVLVVRCFTQHHVMESVGDIIISRQDLYDWPLHIWKYYERENKFEGIGIIQRIERMQLDINAEMSDRRDYRNKILNPPTVVDEALLPKLGVGPIILHTGKILIKPKNLKSQKAADMIHTPTMGPPPSSSAMAELGLEIQTMDDMVGTGPNVLGRYASGRRSAYESGQANQGSAVRFGTIVEKAEVCVLEPLHQQHFLFNQLYMTREARFKHHGQHGAYSLIVTPDDYKLTGGATFIALGSSSIRDKIVETQQFMTALDRAMQHPELHNLMAIYRDMWKMLAPRDYPKYMKDPSANTYNIPPAIENQIMAKGATIPVSPANDHVKHDQVHGAYVNTPDYKLWPEQQKLGMEKHRQGHQMAMQQQAAQMMGGPRPRSNAMTETPTGLSGIAQGTRGTSVGATP